MFLLAVFPQRLTLHWTRGRGDTLWMRPQILYRYFHMLTILHLLDCTTLTPDRLHHCEEFLT